MLESNDHPQVARAHRKGAMRNGESREKKMEGVDNQVDFMSADRHGCVCVSHDTKLGHFVSSTA